MIRRTKIVATLGPATRNPEILAGVIKVGADVLRLNFSHGTRESHMRADRDRARGRRARRARGRPARRPARARSSGSATSRATCCSCATASRSSLTTAHDRGPPRRRFRSPGRASRRRSRANDVIYLADGSIRLRVRETDGNEVLTQGRDRRHGHLAPGHEPARAPRRSRRAIGEADLDWVDFAVEQGVDLIAVSFVRSAADLEPVNARLAERGADIPVIAKIEKREAAEAAEEIVQAATGGIMVARGDLGIELPIETIPIVQKRLLALAGRYAKPSITATQMLASMVRSTAPDARRGDRRRERDLRRHRRADALRGDRGRPAPGRRRCG